MPRIAPVDTSASTPSLGVRPPRQKRTREQWERVLEAGVRLVEDEGYDGFTIAALCSAADVPPRALYARTDSKDALFLAVYEHGMAKVRTDEAAIFDLARRTGTDDHEVVANAVEAVARIFEVHRRFLRAVVLISGTHPEVAQRGKRYRAELARQFTSALEGLRLNPRHQSPAAAREFAFAMVFSAMVTRTAYGPSFGADNVPELTRMIDRYLLLATQ